MRSFRDALCKHHENETTTGTDKTKLFSSNHRQHLNNSQHQQFLSSSSSTTSTEECRNSIHYNDNDNDNDNDNRPAEGQVSPSAFPPKRCTRILRQACLQENAARLEDRLLWTSVKQLLYFPFRERTVTASTSTGSSSSSSRSSSSQDRQKQLNVWHGQLVKRVREWAVLQNLSDQDIYPKIHAELQQTLYNEWNPATGLAPVLPYAQKSGNTGRTWHRVRCVRDLLRKLILEQEYTKTPVLTTTTTEDLRYLDIGCADGTLTRAIAEEVLHIAPRDFPVQVYGIDQWRRLESSSTSSSSTSTSLPFRYFSVEDLYEPFGDENGLRFPWDDDSVHVITAMMVLHHVEDADTYMEEMYRVLQPGGMVVLREHDVDPDTDVQGKMLMDLLHDLYRYAWKQEDQTSTMDTETHLGTTYLRYRSKRQWQEKMRKVGFVQGPSSDNVDTVGGSHPSQSPSSNLLRAFWSVFVKPGEEN